MMTNEQKLTFFQCLFATAWTDGTLGEDERGILTTLFNHVELLQEHRAIVSGWFDHSPEEPQWATSVDDGMRTQLVEQVFFIAASDGVVNTDEIALLNRLRTKLGMDEPEFQKILVGVEKSLVGFVK